MINEERIKQHGRRDNFWCLESKEGPVRIVGYESSAEVRIKDHGELAVQSG